MKLIVISFIAFYLLWVFFLAVMALKRAKDEGKIYRGHDAYYLAISVLWIGFVLDFLVNVFFASIIFLEPPFELTVTERVARWKKEGGYRGDLARWMCAKILDPFQIGGHCR